jgi:hypothetical protein
MPAKLQPKQGIQYRALRINVSSKRYQSFNNIQMAAVCRSVQRSVLQPLHNTRASAQRDLSR